jgi:hypothetical protein
MHGFSLVVVLVQAMHGPRPCEPCLAASHLLPCTNYNSLVLPHGDGVSSDTSRSTDDPGDHQEARGAGYRMKLARELL